MTKSWPYYRPKTTAKLAIQKELMNGLSKAPTVTLFSILPVKFPMCLAKKSPW